ncbi:hypothetical protein LK09_16950 [Microbacterium mangrovi]|uniref:SdpI/YhfL protein family n=2 Tax=Microbacterium mangrovi TaxID=1348253 RepID=A0A0B2A384_9MICO|nr:hypothetical protein LK09_16950 [Microbacterium mangrovi]
MMLAALIVVITIVVVLCAVGRIQRNPLVGIRVATFFASEEAWKVGHRAAIIPLVVAAVLSFGVVALVSSFAEVGDIAGTLINCGLLLASVIWGAVRGSHAIRRQL